MKRFLAGLLAVVLIILPSTLLAGYETLFGETQKAAWAIYAREVGGLKAVCSATAYSSSATETRLLTAGHCFVGSDPQRTDFMATQDHKTFVPATLVRNDLTLRKNARDNSSSLDDYKGHDYAIVSLKAGNQAVVPIGTSNKLTIGEDLVIVGLPFGFDFLAVQGIVGSKDMSLSTLVWNHYMGANIYIAGGNSGSAVVSTKQKAIVGIVVAGPGGQTSMAIFLPIDLVDAPTIE